MKRVLIQIWKILTKDQRRGVLLLMVGALFLALLDTVTVALHDADDEHRRVCGQHVRQGNG